MSERNGGEKTRLRALARRTLEAYRHLNEAAAQSAADGSLSRESLSEAGEALQEVLGELKSAGARTD